MMASTEVVDPVYRAISQTCREAYYLSHCYSVAWDRLYDRWRLSVCLSSLLRSQFWIEFDETLHGHLGPEN